MSWDKLWWQKISVFFRLSIVLRFFFFLSQALPPCLPVPPSYSSTRLDNSDFCEQQRHYLYVQCPANVWFLDCRSSRAILSHQTSTPITQFHPAAMEALFRWYTGLLFSDRLFLLALLFAVSGPTEYCSIFHFLSVRPSVRPSQAWHLNFSR